MRTIIILLFLTLPAFPQMLQGIVGGVAPAATCSTPAQGNLLSAEGFQTATTGYEQSGWGTATGTPDPYYDTTSLTTSKPNGGCNRGFQSNYASSGVWQQNTWDYGSQRSSTDYLRFYLYVVSTEIITSADLSIGGFFNNVNGTDGYRVCAVRLANPGGQLVLRGNGATTSSDINISTGQWYRVEMKCVPNGTSEIKVNGGTAQTFTATGYTSWRAVGIGAFTSSNNAYTYSNLVFDLVAADSTGYIGATP